MLLSTGIQRKPKQPVRPKPLVVAKNERLELEPQKVQEAVATTQEETLEPNEEAETLKTSTLDPITEEAVEKLPEATPQPSVNVSETVESEPEPTIEADSSPSSKKFPKPFYIALGVGALGLVTALVFRGGGASNGRTNLNEGMGTASPARTPDPIPSFNGRTLNIK
jgi:hypothetical protein